MGFVAAPAAHPQKTRSLGLIDWRNYSVLRYCLLPNHRGSVLASEGFAMPSFGLLIFPTAYSIQPADLAMTAERYGFESLWFIDHTHAPVSRRTPYPAGGDLPREYWANYDQFVALAAAATVTTHLKLATGVTLMSERDPFVTAKQVATLDVISNGRVLLGVGAGWNAEEMENHGTAYHDRWRVVRERVLAMKEMWTKARMSVRQ